MQGGELPSIAITIPAMPPEDNMGLGVLELPLVALAAVELGLSELDRVEEDWLVESTKVEIGIVVCSVKVVNISRLCQPRLL